MLDKPRESREFISPDQVRCPSCGEKEFILECYDWEGFCAGRQQKLCPHCGCEYDINVTVSFTFECEPLEEVSDAKP